MTSVAPSRRPTTTRPPGPRGRLLTGNVLAYDADRIGFLSAAVREYGGWRLRAGDSLMFSPYLIHRDPRWWHEPERIDPDRWPAGRRTPGTPTCRSAPVRGCASAPTWARCNWSPPPPGWCTGTRVTVTTPADRPASPQALLVPEGMRVRLVERQPDGSEAPAGRTRTPACP